MGKVQETMTKILIQRIEDRRAAGENVIAPWRMTWDPRLGQPRNMLSGHPYRGVNLFMTLFSPFTSPLWLTRRQVNKLGGRIKRQENGKAEPYTPILYWNFPSKEEQEDGKFPFCRFYQVWNVEQVSGIEGHEKLKIGEGVQFSPIEEAEKIVAGYRGPEIRHGGSRACYTPSADKVSMPEREAFETPEAYYSTLFHELTHSTGHRNRLARDGVANHARFASHEYSQEELVAEMGAAMLCGHAGIEADVDNTAAYLDHWLRKLKREPTMLCAAGGEAQKAVDYIRGIRWQKPE